MLVRAVIVVAGLGFLGMGLVLVGWSSQTAYSYHWQLDRGESVRTDARIDDLRTLTTRRNLTTWELRYAFKVRGDDATYRFSDDIWMLEQGDGWVDVPEDVWDRARESGEIEVEFLRDDPVVNQPVDARRGLGTVVLFLALGVVSAAIGLLLTLGPALGRVRRRRRAPSPHDGPFT